ncbi:KaiC domain-containing protein [Staphylothermus hellenicus]|uniref:Putative circadian clock protein, KaiC n=1 Tax=Staphylothermus hellenicus (strain DSM 12710 / JCM 10830 / BK20S6-10-b1 / P8) TaxID=591019 RepID=D7D9I8_STAHD|nr:KaiC domain-containing protein [Staphylothermus hellenicus]ADI32434.1 putative circadian clock protein, KaiC [Staphylothermus hellenicus DSM 12710]
MGKPSIERLPTGIKGLDEILRGGIPQGFVVAVVGEPGTGKTVFCIHFIGKGLETGDKGIYVTTEESRESIIRQAAMFNIDLRKHVDEGNLVIIDALMEERGDPWSLRELDIEELLSKIIEAKKYLGYGHARLVIDSMSAFWLDKPAMARKYSYIIKRRLARWNMTIILTSQYAVTTSLGFGFGVEHVADGIIRFRKSILGGELKRFLVVEKMRQTDHDKRVFLIDIVDGKGLVVLGPYNISRGEVSLPFSVLAKILSAELKKEAELTSGELEGSDLENNV